MKVAILTILAAAAAVVSGAIVPQKAVIVTYPEGTPDSVMDQAMSAIKEAGGVITHEYKLIKGFAAKAPEKALQTVQAWGVQYNAVIEDDQMVTVSGSG